MTKLRSLILAFALSASLAPALAQAPAPVPALPDTERRTSYTISGTTCACAVGFQLYGDSTDYQNWIEVFLGGVRVNFNDATFGWTLSTPSGSFASLARPISNAVLTFNSVQTGTVQIVGARRPRRTSQFNEGTGVPTRNFNVVLSDLTAQNRELWDKTNDVTGRAILGLPGETIGLLPSAAARANQFLMFNASGNPTTASPTLGLGNVVGPVSSVNNHVAVFSGTTGTVIADGGSIGSTTLTGDVTGSGTVTFATTLATVNANVGSFGSATQCLSVTVNAKGLVTAASVATCAPAFSSVTGQATLAQLPNINNSTILANNSGISAVPSALSPSSIFDMIGSVQGTILYRDAAGWLPLSPGTSGQLLSSGGASANPSWITAAGTGTVTSVANDGSIKSSISSNGAITATGTLGLWGEPGSITNCTIGATVSGGALTVSLLGQNGSAPSASNPCIVSFRNVVAATGDYTYVQVTAATTFATATSGSTFGASNSTPFKLWVEAFNNAGTVVLGVSRQSSATQIFPLNEDAGQSSTACSACGTATSAGVFYTTAAQSSKAIRILGYMEWSSGLATAGTFASGPTKIQLAGPGIKKPGDLVQSARTAFGTVATGTTAFSINNVIPTNTAGDQYMTQAITPTSAANILRVSSEGFFTSNNTAGTAIAEALFQDSISNALVAGFQRIANTSNMSPPMLLSYQGVANATIATTFKIRAGLTGVGTLTFNGEAATQIYGGALNSFIQIDEIMG